MARSEPSTIGQDGGFYPKRVIIPGFVAAETEDKEGLSGFILKQRFQTTAFPHPDRLIPDVSGKNTKSWKAPVGKSRLFQEETLSTGYLALTSCYVSIIIESIIQEYLCG